MVMGYVSGGMNTEIIGWEVAKMLDKIMDMPTCLETLVVLWYLMVKMDLGEEVAVMLTYLE